MHIEIFSKCHLYKTSNTALGKQLSYLTDLRSFCNYPLSSSLDSILALSDIVQN